MGGIRIGVRSGYKAGAIDPNRNYFNPDEMANADLKQAVTKQAPARTKLQLVKATAGTCAAFNGSQIEFDSTSSMGRFAMQLDSSLFKPDQ